MQKSIGIGVENFKEVINENCYYVDKTKYIEDILKDKSKIKLFTRPRRFGKTLNMSTLKFFFDIHNKDENRKLFSGLDIEKSEYFSEQGKYPVIFISMKGIKAITWKDYLYDLKILIGDLYNEFEFIKKVLNESELNIFDKICFSLDEAILFAQNIVDKILVILENYIKKKNTAFLFDPYSTIEKIIFEKGL